MKSNLLPRLLALGFVLTPVAHAADSAAPAKDAPAAAAPAKEADKKSDCEGDCECKKCKHGKKHKECKKCKMHKHEEKGAGHDEHHGENHEEKHEEKK